MGGRPREGAQVTQQSLSPPVELDGLHQPQRQAEHQSQVQGPRPAGLQPGGLHHSALAVARAVGRWMEDRVVVVVGSPELSPARSWGGSPSPLPSEPSV